RLRLQGKAFSAGVLGEAVVSEKEAEAHVARYLGLLDLLEREQAGWKPLGNGHGDLDWGCAAKVNLSVKPSALYSQMHAGAIAHSVSRAKERLRPIFRKAVKMGAHVCLDMEQRHLKDLTLAIYRSLLEEPEFRGYPHTGTVIQSYLRSSEDDLQNLIAWARKRGQRLTVRLVKGAYWETERVLARQRNWPIPFFTNKHETDANFEKLARILMENHDLLCLACASHNIRSISYVMEIAKGMGLPFGCMEFQVLHGMAEPVHGALQRAGVPVRVYTPIGELIPGMAYLIRRLLENTSPDCFLRQHFGEDLPGKEHLKNPLTFVERKAPVGTSGPAGAGTVKPFENEPMRDWTRPEHRKTFARALRDIRKAFPYRVPLFIDGRKATTGREIYSRNPNDPEEIVGMVSSAGREEVEKAVAAAKAAFPAWRDRDPSERARVLFRAAAVARKRRDSLAALQVYEVGKTWSEADADVCEAIDFLEYYGREMIRLAAPQAMGRVPGERSHLFYEARGVAAVIGPWNFPLAISVGMMAAALVTGNTVVYKPSSNSGVTGSMVYTLFQEAGLPSGVLQFLPGPGAEIGNFLARHSEVSLVAFTGSKKVGLRIAALAGRTPPGAPHVKRVVAEMGGKNAIIVDEDANLGEAVLHTLHSAFSYQGQKCSACSRLIVLEGCCKSVVDRLKPAAESLVLGSPEDPATFMGAVIDEGAKKKIQRYIGIGKREGKVLVERRVPNAKGHCVPLVILEDVRPEHRVAQEEIFGPVLAVIKVRDFDEALRVANGTAYALTGAVFSRSPEHIALAKERFRVGNLYINRGCTGALVGRHPFGGFKMSGVGS
ncbi:MAG: bifunctional proline dehydrogenase/L-glutamate gamma-semialdehyde dehydrogenase, partial [Pseudomonadota bacterium]